MRKQLLIVFVTTALVATSAATVSFGQIAITGGPTYNSTSGSGYRDATIPAPLGSAVNNFGTAVGSSKLNVAAADRGSRGIRLDAASGTATELTPLGLDPRDGFTSVVPRALNDAGTIVGYAEAYGTTPGSWSGYRPARWDSSGMLTELGNLGTRKISIYDFTMSEAYDINAAGTAVGYADKNVSDVFLGRRAVRWAASGTIATELGNLGAPSGVQAHSAAYDINDAGVAVGTSDKYVSGVGRGSRAVRWNASGTAAIELGHIGVGTDGQTTFADAYSVNEAGIAVGSARKHNASGVWIGERAVRWNNAGAATELGHLGTATSSTTNARAYAVNEAGTAAGFAQKYSPSGTLLGQRAVRWNAASTTAIELGILGVDGGGVTNAQAYALNDAGTAVGYSQKYEAGVLVGERAVMWRPDGTVIDLNDLGVTSPGGTWTLTKAGALSADGWVSGVGTFTPTTGLAYQRLWVAQFGGLGGSWTASQSGSLNGTWGSGPQWSTGTPALSMGDATFNAAAAYTVGLNRNETTGRINVQAGNVTFDMNGQTLTSLSDVTVSNAQLKITDGTLAGAVAVGSGGTLAGTAAVAGSLNVNSGGKLAPGASPGTINVNGSYNQLAGGTLEVEIAGIAAGQFDVLNVTQSAALAGNLNVVLTGGFNPALGDTFEFLTASQINGQFTTTANQLPQLGEGLNWKIQYSATNVLLKVVSAVLSGDFNHDSIVDAADYLAWRKNGGSPEEYNVWRANFGQSSGSGSADTDLTNAATVPEPSTLMLLFTVAIVASWRQRDFA